VIDQIMTQLIRSKRITYYDEDKQICKTRRFSAIENARVNEIWARIEDILSEQNIKGRYMRLGHNSIFSFCQFSLIIWYKASLWVSNVLVKNDQIHPKKASRNKYFRIHLN
jgi:hypothetical protein